MVLQVIIVAICIFSATFGILGNFAIIFVRICKERNRKRTTPYAFLICQLALADLIFAITIIFDIHVLLNNNNWIFGKVGCKLIKTMQSISVSTTIGLLTLMSYERFCGVSKPLSHRWNLRKLSLLVVGIWAYILITFIPLMTALDVSNGECFEVNHPSETFRKGYTLFLFVTNFVIPLLCIIIFHILIVKVTKKHLKDMGIATINYRGKKTEEINLQAIQESDNDIDTGPLQRTTTIFSSIKKRGTPFRRRKLSLASRTNDDGKLVKTLVIITLCVVIMILPTQIWYLWYDFGSSSQMTSKAALNILEVFASLVYLHCCVNCIVYSIMDKRFRSDCWLVLRRLCKKKRIVRRSSTRQTRISNSSTKSTRSM